MGIIKDFIFGKECLKCKEGRLSIVSIVDDVCSNCGYVNRKRTK